MARHEADSYSLHRPLYPVELFDRVLDSPRLRECALGGKAFTVADLACGTGQSVRSWLAALHARGLESAATIRASDLDGSMIERARSMEGEGARVEWRVGPAEDTGLESGVHDAVSILSAYHWFDRARADEEILRLLAPEGALLIAEYQFPSCSELPELNEWIRRSFNQSWKFADQKPRGSLRDLVSGLLADPRLEGASIERIPMTRLMDADEVAGLLLSQARVISFLERESAGDPHRRDVAERAIIEGIRSRMPAAGGARFDFRLTAFSARKRSAAATKAR